jgi:hypothetical protein
VKNPEQIAATLKPCLGLAPKLVSVRSRHKDEHRLSAAVRRIFSPHDCPIHQNPLSAEHFASLKDGNVGAIISEHSSKKPICGQPHGAQRRGAFKNLPAPAAPRPQLPHECLKQLELKPEELHEGGG